MTAIDQILEALKAGEKLTCRDGWTRFGCSRLPNRILDLQQKGYDIRHEWVKVPTRNGGTALVMCYSMPSQQPELFELPPQKKFVWEG